MQVDISFKQMSSSDEVRDYAVQKSERLKKYFHGKIHVTWTFSHNKKSFVAHCHLLGNHMDYFGEAETQDDYNEAVDAVIDKIERQVRKHKEVVKDHLHRQK